MTGSRRSASELSYEVIINSRFTCPALDQGCVQVSRYGEFEVAEQLIRRAQVGVLTDMLVQGAIAEPLHQSSAMLPIPGTSRASHVTHNIGAVGSTLTNLSFHTIGSAAG